MRTKRIFSIELPFTIERIFSWFENSKAFERLIPRRFKIKILKQEPLKKGSTFVLKKNGIEFTSQITQVVKNSSFVDEQIQGPFLFFKHQHFFYSPKTAVTYLEDQIEFELPFLKKLFLINFNTKLEKTFAYRKRILLHDLAIQKKLHPHQLKVAISGTHGLIGHQLVNFLESQGHIVTPIVRNRAQEGIFYDPEKNSIEKEKLEGFDAIIHLGGHNVMKKMTKKQLHKVIDSRLKSTRLIVDTINKLKKPPKTFLCASASGFYGNTEEVVDENSPQGEGILAKLCNDWEQIANQAKCRVVNLRIGGVLDPVKGMLKPLLLPFKLGLGGKIGRGKSFMNWIVIDDLLYAIYFALCTHQLKGPINLVSKEGHNNEEFSRILAKVLKRPLFFTYPESIFNWYLKDLAKVTALCHTKIVPKKLLDAGFEFAYPNLTQALKHILD